MHIQFALLLVVASAFIVHGAVPIYWSAVGGNARTGGCKVVAGKSASAGAWAYYTNAVNTTGWAKLNVVTNQNGFSDADQAYLAGCVEGTIRVVAAAAHLNGFRAFGCNVQASLLKI